ncbi:serine acetyltransferase [Klebsiella michiganensis]|uniref:serine O-acetyltransferase n=1 Tax=Klebsiella michiganensis TaxID=1134687 RepID=UPI0013D2226A|nr:serine acetyltransferase [Klebsiella michiganensis]NRG25437.1 serine acetyltransferase [Klebsiella michiganensis]HDX8851223.1 serine acetyltransferase [Klebsiella michiganensis]
MIRNVVSILKKNSYFFVAVRFLIKIFRIRLSTFVRWLNNRYYAYFYFNSRSLIYSCHITVGIKYLYEKNTHLPHPIGITIGKKVILGTGCTIYQNVTLGVKNNKFEDYPTLGDNVTVYANACILGGVTVGNNVIVGFGSLVDKDVPDNVIVAGCPATIIKYLK